MCVYLAGLHSIPGHLCWKIRQRLSKNEKFPSFNYSKLWQACGGKYRPGSASGKETSNSRE